MRLACWSNQSCIWFFSQNSRCSYQKNRTKWISSLWCSFKYLILRCVHDNETLSLVWLVSVCRCAWHSYLSFVIFAISNKQKGYYLSRRSTKVFLDQKHPHCVLASLLLLRSCHRSYQNHLDHQQHGTNICICVIIFHKRDKSVHARCRFLNRELNRDKYYHCAIIIPESS